MRERRCRQEVIVVAKVAHPDGTISRVTQRSIRDDLARTLSMLDTDYVDVLMLHRDDPSQPVGPIIDELACAQAAGTIGAFAASNWTVPRLEEAAAYAHHDGLPGFAASSVYYSLAVPTTLPWSGCVDACDPTSQRWYARTRMPLLAYSPLGFGYLAKAQHSARAVEEVGVPRDATGVDFDKVFSHAARTRRRRVIEVARTKNVSMAQIALAWVLQQPLNVFAVAGPQNETELRDLFKSFEVSLTLDEPAWLSADHDQ